MGFVRAVSKTIFAAGDLLVPSPPGPRVLIYHRVGLTTGQQMEVTVANFRRQLSWLQTRYEVVDLATAISRWHDLGSDRLVVLTFDDGYQDTRTVAYPMLVEREMPFTVYIATQQVETATRSSDSSGGSSLTWSDIAEMDSSKLLTIGAHTHTHKDLRYADETQVVDEIVTSNGLIEARLGRSAKHFAYPWGYWSETAHRFVVRTYESATLGAASKSKVPFDAHLLHRYPVQLDDSFAFFKARLRGGLIAEERLRRRLRRYSGP